MLEIIVRIIVAFLSVSTIGIIFGVGLAFFSKIFHVEKDKLLEKLEDTLPGLNCGACGYAGCVSYAEAIAQKKEDTLTLCTPGGENTATDLSNIMGKEITISLEKNVAQVHCRGDKKTSEYNFEYDGIADCNALFALYGGDKKCTYGCLGQGSCIKVCPVDAIIYTKDGLVWVNKELCITCGKCVDICPTGVMKLIPHDSDFLVACNSTDKGGKVKKYCKVGCIGCKICVKKSPDGGYIVEDFLAHIDYSQKGDRKAGVEKCPSKCIVVNNTFGVMDEKK